MSRGPLDYCPDCGKKGVSIRLRPRGEDHLGCRYCSWGAYTHSDSRIDMCELSRYDAAQLASGKVPPVAWEAWAESPEGDAYVRKCLGLEPSAAC